MYCSIQQALILWDELRNATENKASHGHEAEIYAYTLMQNHPSGKLDSVEIIRAAKTLINIVDLFCESYTEKEFLIDGIEPHSWLELYGNTFDHRIKIRCVTQ